MAQRLPIEKPYDTSAGGRLASSNPLGRVDQLEDRYLGMVEAPSSNLGVSTLTKFNYTCGHSGIRTSLCSVLSLGVSISMNLDA